MTVIGVGQQESEPAALETDNTDICLAQRPLDSKSRYHVLESIGRGSFGEAWRP